MSFLSKLGFKLNKVMKGNAELPEEEIVDPALVKMKQERQARYDKDTEDTASLYSKWIPADVFKQICDGHNFLHAHWGSRKVGRLTNLCRNILDVECSREGSDVFAKDFHPILRMLLWCSLLYPTTVMWALRVENVEHHFKEKFANYLSAAGFNGDEQKIMLHAIFTETRTEPGNIVLDVWHDALRFEEMQFGYIYSPDVMRTSLGKNKVFSAKAKRDGSANLSPHWLMLLQEHLGETRFTNEKITFTSDETGKKDSIS